MHDNGAFKNRNWYKSQDFMNFIREIYELSDFDISKHLILKRKNFIKQNYLTTNDLKGELLIRRQLYLYYILHIHVLDNKWNWNSQKYNFGAYSYVKNGEKSIFENLKIFQLYDKQWRYNQGYNPIHGLWIQNYWEENRDYFSELLNWANA